MTWSRVAIIGSICLGLSAATAQQRDATTAATAKAPPLFQGVMEDAKGKTVGRFLTVPGVSGLNYAVRQLSGVWVILKVDPVTGFLTIEPMRPEIWLEFGVTRSPVT
jgi:hypothetical protein